MSLRLSRKHGVNPSVDVCFWCGEAKGVVLMGAIRNDAEAPRECITSYDPCPSCQDGFSQGFLLIEATQRANARTSIEMQRGIYPTGDHWVIKTEAAIEIFGEKNCEKGMAFIDRETAERVGLRRTADDVVGNAA